MQTTDTMKVRWEVQDLNDFCDWLVTVRPDIEIEAFDQDEDEFVVGVHMSSEEEYNGPALLETFEALMLGQCEVCGRWPAVRYMHPITQSMWSGLCHDCANKENDDE